MSSMESMADVYIYETQQLLQSLDNVLLEGEKEKRLTPEGINEVFRSMHTIKGSSAMMEYDALTAAAHAIEDVFALIRDSGATEDEWPQVFELAFETVSYIGQQVEGLQNGVAPEAETPALTERTRALLERMRARVAGGPLPSSAAVSCYKVIAMFEQDCLMESVRAMGLVKALSGLGTLSTVPEKLDTASDGPIRESGLIIYIHTDCQADDIKAIMEETLFLESYSISAIDTDKPPAAPAAPQAPAASQAPAAPAAPQAPEPAKAEQAAAHQSFISVNVGKLDSLLDIVGEIVTAQSAVASSAGNDVSDSFNSAMKQMRGLINELQDIVMSVRMLPVSNVFQKMKRIVRDMSKKVDKDIDLVLVGEDTEVDKNVIDCLSDPLMHLIRNSVDHGIEDAESRIAAGKPAKGCLTLEACATGSDVVVTVSDDGQGLQRDAILKKAREKGLLTKPESQLTDADVYSLIFLPGFSTKDVTTEFSGRGVGMDVVRSNVAKVGGALSVSSQPGQGTVFTIRIPLTLTIVDGMRLEEGGVGFVVPTTAIQTVLKPTRGQVMTDPSGNKMILLHGEYFSVIRMGKLFGVTPKSEAPEDGMLMLLKTEERAFCILFDHLDNVYQMVSKALPPYLDKCSSTLECISGCAIFGDGSINLIVDVNALANKK